MHAETATRTFGRMRAMNQEIATEAAANGEPPEPVAFVCECARPGCFRPVWLDLAAYRARLRRPGVRLLAPGHEAAAEDVPRAHVAAA